MPVLYAIGYLLIRIFSKTLFRIKTSGQENFPRKGGFILAANHISYYDPPLLGSWAPRVVCFMAKQELFQHWLLGAIIKRTNALPLNRHGFDRQAIKISLTKIREGLGLVVFPEGTRSKSGEFRKPKAGVGLLAGHARCPIIPAYIEGPNHLKDCFWGRRKMRIVYGEPISSEWITSRPDGKAGYEEITNEVMRRIGHIRDSVANLK